jgi:TatD DNase family protein
LAYSNTQMTRIAALRHFGYNANAIRSSKVLIDSHCHIFMPDFAADTGDVLSRARAAGVAGLVLIGYDIESSRAAIQFADTNPDCYACVAIHPHHADQAGPEALAILQELVHHPKVIGVGEIGLDFFRNRSPRPVQESAFRAQLQLAGTVGLPVVIHDRDAHQETMHILAEGPEVPAVILHCFSADQRVAQDAWAKGYYTGIGGPLTYSNANGLREIFRTAPHDRVLLETDAPYLPPTPHRGKRNEPSYLPLVAARLAALWEVEVDRVAECTTGNVRRVFALEDRR